MGNKEQRRGNTATEEDFASISKCQAVWQNIGFGQEGARIDKEEYGGVNYVLKETGQLALRNIETVLCTSLIWSILLILGLLAFPMPLSGLYAAFVGPLGLVMVLRFTFLAVRHKRNKWAFFRRGLPRLLLSGSVVGVMYAAAFIVVYSAWWYYDRASLPALVISILQTYLMMMVVMALTYVLPLVVQTQLPIGRAIHISAKFFFTQPIYTLLLWLQIVTVGLLLVVTTIGFILVFSGLLGIFLNVATENLCSAYGIIGKAIE